MRKLIIVAFVAAAAVVGLFAAPSAQAQEYPDVSGLTAFTPEAARAALARGFCAIRRGSPLFPVSGERVRAVLTAEGEAFLVDAQRQLKAMAASQRANVAANAPRASSAVSAILWHRLSG